MDLHIRIFLGYGWLVAWLIVAAAGAALGFHQLGATLATSVASGTRHVQTTLTAVDAFERQEAAVRRALLGDLGARQEVRKGWASLEHVVVPPTGDTKLDVDAVARDLRWTFARWHEAAENQLAARSVAEVALPLADYEAETGSAYRAVKGQLHRLLETNVRAAVDHEDKAVQTARRYAFVYGAVLVLVLITVGYVSRLLRRRLVDRLVALAQVAQAVASGERHRRATAGPDDELGIIARQFNQLLDHDRALQAEMQGRLSQQRQMLIGFVQDAGRPLALYTIYGDLAVTNLDGKIREELLAAHIDFPKLESGRDQTFTAPLGKTHQLRFRLFHADQTRPVGWVGEVE